MSYRIPKKANDYTQQITLTKTTITNEREYKEEPNNYNEEDIKDVIKAFEYFDMDHDGKINIFELKKILSSFGNIMTEEEIYNIFRAAGIDQNNNEDIDYIQFVNLWIGNN